MEREADRYKDKNATFKDKLINFWDYNKKIVIIGIIALAVLIYLISMPIMKDDYDIYIIYITETSVVFNEDPEIKETLVPLKELFESNASDTTGDGKITVMLQNFTVGEGEIMTFLQSGECMLVVADEAGIKDLYDRDYLEDISDIVGTESYDGKAWKLNTSEAISEKLGISEKNPLYLGIRKYTDTMATGIVSMTENYEHAKKILTRMSS